MTAKVSNGKHMKVYTDPTDLPEQAYAALESAIGDVPLRSKVCICSIGASAIAGEIMSDFADASSNVPISVVHGAILPKWVDMDTAVIAMSYTGNTPETLSLYDQAVSRGCDIICITSGGGLMERAVSNGNMLITVPEGLLPRSSLGYMLGSIASLFEKMGICNSKTELMKALPSVKAFRDEILADEENNQAAEIARTISGKIPVIYSLMSMRTAAIRWKMQINENSRTIAFCGTIPEFNHNEIVGWTEDQTSNEFIPIILCDDDSEDILKCMTDTLLGILESKSIEPYRFKATGSTDLEKNLISIILGDFVSLYLAHMKDVHPGEVDLDLGNGGYREFN